MGGSRWFSFESGKEYCWVFARLQDKLETVRTYAQQNNAVAQQRRIDRYNTRAREKHFQLGDQVLLLCPDSTSSRTFRRWRGPGNIVEVRSPHSYIVDLDGARQHVHANRLKRFIVSSYCVIIQPDFETVCVLENSTKSDVCDANTSSTSDEKLCSGRAEISDCDSDFGDVHTFEQTEEKPLSLPSQTRTHQEMR